MKLFYVFLIFLSLLFSACSSKQDSTIIDTNTQQKNAKEALREL